MISLGVLLTPIIVKKELVLDDLRGKSFAVDGYIVLHQFLALIRDRTGTPLMDQKGNVYFTENGVVVFSPKGERLGAIATPERPANVVFGGKVKDDDMTDELRKQFYDELVRGSEPWEAAGLGFVDKIIDPADTRKELIRALARARGPKGDRGMSRRLLAGWPRMF